MSAKSWPTYESMKEEEFKVVFKLSRNIPQILDADTEFLVKYSNGDWFFKLPGMFLLKLSDSER